MAATGPSPSAAAAESNTKSEKQKSPDPAPAWLPGTEEIGSSYVAIKRAPAESHPFSSESKAEPTLVTRTINGTDTQFRVPSWLTYTAGTATVASHAQSWASISKAAGVSFKLPLPVSAPLTVGAGAQIDAKTASNQIIILLTHQLYTLHLTKRLVSPAFQQAMVARIPTDRKADAKDFTPDEWGMLVKLFDEFGTDVLTDGAYGGYVLLAVENNSAHANWQAFVESSIKSVAEAKLSAAKLRESGIVISHYEIKPAPPLDFAITSEKSIEWFYSTEFAKRIAREPALLPTQRQYRSIVSYFPNGASPLPTVMPDTTALTRRHNASLALERFSAPPPPPKESSCVIL